jgi:hypothetical protein
MTKSRKNVGRWQSWVCSSFKVFGIVVLTIVEFQQRGSFGTSSRFWQPRTWTGMYFSWSLTISHPNRLARDLSDKGIGYLLKSDLITTNKMHVSNVGSSPYNSMKSILSLSFLHILRSSSHILTSRCLRCSSTM